MTPSVRRSALQIMTDRIVDFAGSVPSHRTPGTSTMKIKDQYVELDPQRIADASQRLADRIQERMPSRQLASHARSFAGHSARIVRDGSMPFRAPLWMRIVSWIGGSAALLLLLSPLVFVRRTDGIDVLPTFLQALDSTITTFAATVAGFFTMRSISQAHTRKRALEALETLRSFAHVTDMLQLNKSPARILFPTDPTASSPVRETDVATLGAYLAYCGELAALISKIAALHGRWIPDATVISTIDDIEDRCSELEMKIGQKLILLERFASQVKA